MVFTARKHIFNQLLSSVTAFLTVLNSGMWLGWSSIVVPRLKKGELLTDVSSEVVTWTVALMDLGNLLSPIPASLLMEKYGRLLVLRLATLAYILAAVFVLIATHDYHLYVARFLAGMGKGIAFTTATLYVGEIAAPNIRGALCGVCSVMSLSGTLTSMTIGPYVSTQTLNFILLGIPIVDLVLTFFIVESPHYFLMRNQGESARKALAQIRDTDYESELSTIKEKVEGKKTGLEPFGNLLSTRANRRALAAVLVTGVLERASGISWLYAYASTTLPPNPWKPEISVMIFSWLCVVSALVGMSLVDKLGRKPLMLISTIGLAVVLATTAAFYYFSRGSHVDTSSWDFVPHVDLLLYAILFGVGVGQIPHTLHCEVFPASVKSQASAVATIFLGLTSFVTTKMHSVVERSFGVYLMFVVFAIASTGNFFFTLFYLPETKGKTLAEISVLLER